jgi:hypothetical protein
MRPGDLWITIKDEHTQIILESLLDNRARLSELLGTAP